jgi:hypothetical protein
MARPIRSERPGAWYQVTARGNEWRAIYRGELGEASGGHGFHEPQHGGPMPGEPRGEGCGALLCPPSLPQGAPNVKC